MIPLNQYNPPKNIFLQVHSFVVGSIVILKRLRNRKLEPHVFGPYKIISFKTNPNFDILLNLSTNRETTSSLSNLYPLNI